jgi:hypothetical protein
MEYPVDLIEDRGGFIFDRVSKSSLSKPAAYCVDLDGCGAPTHIKYAVDFTLNSRFDCSAPQPALVGSYSGLLKLNPNDFLINLDPFAAATQNFLLGYARSAPDTLLTPTDFYDSLLGALGLIDGGFQNRAKSFVWDNIGKASISSGVRGQVSVGRPSLFLYDDNCGTPAGLKMQASSSLTMLEEITCKPVLVAQQSIKLAASFEAYNFSSIATFTNAQRDAVAQDILDLGIGAITAAVASNVDCEVISNTFFGLLEFPNTFTAGIA